jgi:hypothetical protein
MMVEKTATKTFGPARRREEAPSAVQPAEASTISTVESAVQQEGLTAPEVLALALLVLLVLVALGSMMLVLAII